MAHRVAPQAEAELDNIWYYVAKESGSVEIADRLIDSITEAFSMSLPATRISEAIAMRICAQGCAVFPWASMSLSIASKRRTC